MADLWSDLLDCLDLVPAAAAGTFDGRNQQLTYHRVFGGQLLAQFVRAAALSCPGKAVKSLHVVFSRAGRTDEPVRYEVTRHHEGATFATLSVLARQAGGVVATASASTHAGEDGLDRQTAAAVPTVPGTEHRLELDLLPWDTRSLADLDATAAGTPEVDLWMRTPPTEPDLAPALTAYATDLSLIATALRHVDGVGQRDTGRAFTSAVTSHTLWFHRPFRTDTWLLLRQHSPLLAHGRCFGRGDVHTEDGTLVASYAQEALLRFHSEV
ncbi:acyl-CoA thioesterase [Actinophytocola oryzae]|uniref:Acyl-CoA thioesterase-2 n=1 Tax=Actinophytocola oryzae TaxID=502181 RepID=A0A4R7VKQ2_9PSEU|nr:acyl-CoA thioesterase domain-containing protein [Actinophytocola oryzae]TDV49827.1 acyl-CoA thioesterase-2 [Actinophytocola oryzae]